MAKVRGLGMLALVATFLGAASVAHAATIKTDVPMLMAGPGVLVPFGGTPGIKVTTPTPNNNNTTLGLDSRNNVVKIHKQFNQNGPIDIVFAAINSGGTTEYFFGEKVFNNTGIPWSGYTFELGFFTGAQFVPSSTAKLTFDIDDSLPTPASVIGPTDAPLFGLTSHTANTIAFGGGSTLASGGLPGKFGFSIDLNDIAQGKLPPSLQVFGNNSNFRGYLFTLRQTPTPTPEPGTLLLIGSGLVGIGVGSRRRNRQK